MQPQEYQIVQQLHTDKHGTYFEGSIAHTPCILYILNASSLSKLNRMEKIGLHLQKCEHMIKYEGTQVPCCIVLQHENFVTLKQATNTITTTKQVQLVMYQILQAVAECHKHGVMHRNVQPNNIWICNQNMTSNQDTMTVKLSGLALAEFYQSGHEYNLRLASRYCSPPEWLCNHVHYDCQVDMWHVGCVFASLLFGKDPFTGRDNLDQLVKIARVLGSSKLFAFTTKYNLDTTHWFPLLQQELYSGMEWEQFITPTNLHLVTSNAIDLLSKLLQYDPQDRITAADALLHPYFQ